MEGKNIFKMIAGFVREHRCTRIGRAVTDALACVVIFATVYALILPAITESADTICGKEEHTHTEECYASAYDLDKVELSCMEGLHQHIDDCYDKDGDLICGYADYYIHTHDESCYDEDGVLICPLKEHTGKTHTHDKDCYDEDGNLICNKLQVEAHQHTADCYDEDNLADAVSGTTLICDKEEHTHKDTCYADSSNDADSQGSTAVVDAEDDTEEEAAEEDGSLNISSGTSRNSKKAKATGTVTDSTAFRNASTVTYTNATYDGTDYTTQLTVKFTDLSTGYIKDENYTIYYYLPDGVSPPSDYVEGTELSGYDSAGNLGFTYSYKKDSNEDWYVEINFVQSYIDSAGSTVSGNFSFTATIDSTSWDDAQGLVIKYKDQTVLTISASEITWEQGTSAHHDLSVTKSASSYDAATNSITYTVTVTSDKGTEGNVSLSDVLTLPSGLTVDSVTLTSITYNTGAGQYGSYATTDDVTSNYSSSFEYNSSDYTTSLTLGTMEAGSSYVIKYTVTFDEISAGNYSEKVGNKVTASSDDSVTGKIEDTAEKSVTVTYNILAKSATRNETTGDITWKIVVNESGADIAGTTLTDVMMSELTCNDVTVTGGTDGTDYVFLYDPNDDTKITGIQFLPADGSTPNTNTYTITYTTTNPLTWGEGQTNITNTAELKGEDIDTSAVKNANESISGSLTKTESADATYTDTDNDGVNDQATLTWSASAVIPAGGILAGTELTDYLSGALNYTTVDDQWYTYSQICTDFNSIAYNLAITDMDGNNNLANLTRANGDYTLSFYDKTAGGTWVSYYDLVANQSTYENHVFTAWKITFNKDVTLTAAGKFSLTYTSTADVSGVTDKKEYTNAINVANITATAEHVEAVDVLKMDAKENAEDSTTTSTDGTVAWKVRISADSITSESSVTVTDTLPAGVTLSAIYLSEYTSSAITYDESAGTLSKGYWTGSETLYVTGTVTTEQTTGQQVIKLTIPSSVYSYMANDSGFIWIYYQCKLSDDLIANGTANGTTVTISGLTNSVTVQGESGTEIGTDTQTQTVEYTKQMEEVDVLSKSSSWDNTQHYMNYSIVINPEKKDLLTGGDELSLEDVLSVKYNITSNPKWGLTASLMQSSVKFYEAVYNDTTQQYEKGNELSIAWTYDSESAERYNDGTVCCEHTISATIPDETAIIMEYTYYLTNMADGVYRFNSGDMSNTVTLTGDSVEEDTESSNEEYSDTGYSASITGGDTYYRVYKVDSGNYGTTLDGAVFTLFRYDSSATEWVSTGLTYTTSNGVLIVTKNGVESASQYYANTAYKLVETTAPDGYVADSSLKLWFYWSDSTVATSSYPDNFTSSAMDLSLSAESVYVPNEPTPTTEVSVEKKWVDTDGTTEKTTGLPSSITVDLYRYSSTTAPGGTAGGGTATDTYDVYVGAYGSYTNVESVPEGKEATITISATYLSWYYAGYTYSSANDLASYNGSASGSFSVIVPSTNTQDVYISYDTISTDDVITIDYDGKNTGGGTGNTGNTTYTESDLTSLGGTLYQSGIEITDADSWTKTISDLPAQGDDGNGNTIYYYYYFVERSVAGYTTAYSSGEGVTDGGTITITNTSTGESYVLPVAGGPGTIWYMMSGLLLMLAAAVALYINHRRERTSVKK